ncbi:MAG TPA: single-stranded DNA-binding protein [Acidimicrobiales bacterium]|nr:single-stranded DNA-binding protein [Acidimicrobiales bacterium]
MINVVVIGGRLARPPERRVLPSGTVLVSLEVTVERPGGRAESVPVVWFDAPARATDLETDGEVVIVGRVRRRFFRSGGVTQSRTEVVADAVLPASARRRSRRLLAQAAATLESAADDGR